MDKKAKMRKPANTLRLNNNRPMDVKSIENLKELAKVLPGCSDITGALRYLCEDVAPRERERYLALRTA